jgi:hypothetical protein
MFKNLSRNTTRSAADFRAFGPSVEAFKNQMLLEREQSLLHRLLAGIGGGPPLKDASSIDQIMPRYGAAAGPRPAF